MAKCSFLDEKNLTWMAQVVINITGMRWGVITNIIQSDKEEDNP